MAPLGAVPLQYVNEPDFARLRFIHDGHRLIKSGEQYTRAQRTKDTSNDLLHGLVN